MDVAKMLVELYAERQGIDEAILVLERLLGGKRLGRPPKWLSKHVGAVPSQAKPQAKRVLSAETRKRMAAAQAKRWAAARARRGGSEHS